jgi:23S rRNA pseudouridine2457 synthase
MKKLLYLAFYKPYGILSQFTADHAEETLSHFNLPKDVYACGRLDKDSEGLLLLTNDGALIERMLNPKNEKEKTYWAQVENIPSEEQLIKLRAGVLIGDYHTKTCKVKILDPQPIVNERVPPIRVRQSIPTCWIEIILTEGKNRQVRKMTAAVGYPTLRLIRTTIGKLSLTGLTEGHFREIKREDII